jgi:Uncharacterized conserved protein
MTFASFHEISLWFVWEAAMFRKFAVVVEQDTETGLYVGYVADFPGAHTQAETLVELHENMREVIELLLEKGDKEEES